MKRLWRWIVGVVAGRGPGVQTPGCEKRLSGTLTATADGSSPLPLSLAHGGAVRSGEGDGDGDGNDDGNGDDYGLVDGEAAVAERLGRLEVRLTAMEAAMAVTVGDLTTGGEVGLTDDEASVLAKAQDTGGAHPGRALAASEDGSTGELPVGVSRGIPQGIPGQHASRKATRLWEGVL